MTHEKSWIAKLSNSQQSKHKSRMKNDTEVAFNLSSNTIFNPNDAINSPQKLLLTDRQVSRFLKAFSNNSSTNIKLSKTQMSKIM